MVTFDFGAIAYRFLEIIIAPMKNFEMFWILIPVYISWILGDYYQEKKGTDYGNAIANGFVIMWVGLDWGRELTRIVSESGLSYTILIQGLVTLTGIIYGFIILWEGIRHRKITHYIGRLREVTYFIICATPIFYQIVPIDWDTFFAIIIFFPIFYFTFEIILNLLPNPFGEEEEMEEGKMEELPSVAETKLPEEPILPQKPQQQYPQQTYPQYSQQQYPQYPQQYSQYQQQYPQYSQQQYSQQEDTSLFGQVNRKKGY